MRLEIANQPGVVIFQIDKDEATLLDFEHLHITLYPLVAFLPATGFLILFLLFIAWLNDKRKATACNRATTKIRN